ncbi:MAG TPA: DUF3567 family protein [Burkholderiales bacterium]|nr:DUF3567 family protein [Burkholderiales bacterium]
MQIVYDSKKYCVIEYSGLDGFEVTSKSAHAGTYFHGAAAVDFRDSLAKAISTDPTTAAVDEFLGGFDGLMTLPAVLH